MKRGRCGRVYHVKSKPVEIDYDKLADAIVAAHERIEKDAERKQMEAQNAWREHLGVREDGKLTFRAVGRLLFLKKEAAKNDFATTAVTKSLLIWILRAFQIAALLGTAVSVVGVFNVFDFSTWTAVNLLFILFTLIFMALFCVLRITILEIEQMKDRQYLLAILSAITSFLAMILALIALFVR
mgnify:CR=1 FL=1